MRKHYRTIIDNLRQTNVDQGRRIATLEAQVRMLQITADVLEEQVIKLEETAHD